MHFAMNHLGWGAHRGGMFVEIQGTDAHGAPVRKSWHLVAEGDDGPMVPVLAAVLIIRRCIHGHFPAPGARPATDELDLEDFSPLFKALTICTGERVNYRNNDAPVFRTIVGDAWKSLASPVRQLHDSSANSFFTGRASVRRGTGAVARIIGRLAGLPKSSNDKPITVRIVKDGDKEIWTRNFDSHSFSSELSVGREQLSALLCERFGPCRFGMALVADGPVLRYVPRRWTFLGVRMPGWMMPRGDIYETACNGRFVFHVEITLPLAGHVVSYAGWLTAGDQTFSNSCTAR